MRLSFNLNIRESYIIKASSKIKFSIFPLKPSNSFLSILSLFIAISHPPSPFTIPSNKYDLLLLPLQLESCPSHSLHNL